MIFFSILRTPVFKLGLCLTWLSTLCTHLHLVLICSGEEKPCSSSTAERWALGLSDFLRRSRCKLGYACNLNIMNGLQLCRCGWRGKEADWHWKQAPGHGRCCVCGQRVSGGLCHAVSTIDHMFWSCFADRLDLMCRAGAFQPGLVIVCKRLLRTRAWTSPCLLMSNLFPDI